ANASAISGQNYTAVNTDCQWLSAGARQIKDGQSGVMLTGAFLSFVRVPIIDDSSFNQDRTLTVSLTTRTATNGGFINLGGSYANQSVLVTNNVALGFQNTATLSIVNDDFLHGVIVFSGSTYSVLENAGSATIEVYRTNGSAGTVTADYFTSVGGTNPATAGSDYIAVSGRLTFLGGETNKSFTVPIINDVLVEQDETIILTLTNATGSATIGVPGAATNAIIQATLTIIDDDFAAGRISLASSSYVVTEDAGSVQVVVQRNGGAQGAASAVFFSTNGPSATNLVDFTGVTNTLTWGNGDGSTRTITIPILNNLNVDGTRVFGVSLTNITTAIAGLTTNASITINDDDAYGNISFSSATYGVAENGGAVTITLIRQNGNGGSVNATVYSSNLTATAGTDFVGVTNLTNFF
ncbi:MAG: hypothetical protein EB082_20510, partial [Verrucomicrobia bacterium]|nr:hypothetical protein [Verrucomicrobiota bacterium]NDF01293.1 hypothetical protein [Verrucomicrobiota bacterium]